jgi:Zn-dependent protease/CBS domain-containing protein
MMRSSLTLVRIGGIRIGIHYTWVLAFALIAWSLAEGLFADGLPGQGRLTYWLMGAVGALLLFASVLAHELSHSFIARMRGLQVDSITLFIFGGVSNLSSEVSRPFDEFLVAIVGPACSLVVAALAWVLRQALPPGPSVGATLLEYVAVANTVLGVFNLMPGFPLDGGRVLRGMVWAVTGSLRQATQIASYVGQFTGFGLILFGLSELLGGYVLTGLWIAFIGWFLNGAAESTRREYTFREALTGIPIRSIMDPAPPTVGPDIMVQQFVFDFAVRRGVRAVLVTDGPHLVGLASLSDAEHIHQEAWPTTPVGSIMTRAPLLTVTPDDDLVVALELMANHSVHQLPVVSDGQVVGLITRAEILSILQVRDELGLTAPQTR